MSLYTEFVEFIQPLLGQEHGKRLDGREGGGNRTPFGFFDYGGRTWRVNSDSHYGPLELAYSAALAGRNPFVEAETDRGKLCLELMPDLSREYNPHFKYLYIYAV